MLVWLPRTRRQTRLSSSFAVDANELIGKRLAPDLKDAKFKIRGFSFNLEICSIKGVMP